MIGCPDKRTPKDESEPVDGNTQSEESLAKVNKECDEALEDAKPTPIVRQTDDKHDDMEVSKTQNTVKYNQPIQKGFGFLTHRKSDHWYICPQY